MHNSLRAELSFRKDLTAINKTTGLGLRSAARLTTAIVAAASCLVIFLYILAPTGALAKVAARNAHPPMPPTMLLPIPQGALAATCFSGYNNNYSPASGIKTSGYVVGIVDVRNPAGNGAVQGVHWSPGMYHNELTSNANPASHKWTAANLGQVYGVTLDDASNPNIYVASSAIYGPYTFPNGGTGGEVFRLDGTTGDILRFPSLPNSGQGFGNISFHRYSATNSHLIVSNFEDGKIYRLDLSGNQMGTPYDHGVDGRPKASLAIISDDPTKGFTPLGRRVWAVQTYQGRLYYSAYVEDEGTGRKSGTENNQIWSVALDGAGNFMPASAKLEFSVPSMPGTDNPVTDLTSGVSNPISDITFSPTGTMLLAERTMFGDRGSGMGAEAHRSRVLEYKFDIAQSKWVSSGQNFSVGNYNQHFNSAGGIDTNCQGDVWQTGDALIFGSSGRPTGPPFSLDPANAVYGLQMTPAIGNTGGTTAADINLSTYVGRTSYYVDLDGDVINSNKTQIGSLEIYKKCQESAPCAVVTTKEISCKTEGAGGFTYTFNVLNNSGKDANQLLLTPNGPFTITSQMPPLPGGVLLNGTSTTVTVTIGGAQPGQQICFWVTLMRDGAPCCTVRVCLEAPFCCARVNLDCPPKENPAGTYALIINNQTLNNVEHIYLYPPAGVTITPNYFSVSLAPGSSIIKFVTITGVTPEKPVCIRISLHTKEMKECCSLEICLRVPYCGKPIGSGPPKGNTRPVAAAAHIRRKRDSRVRKMAVFKKGEMRPDVPRYISRPKQVALMFAPPAH
jgi:hypothetical protein